MDEDDITRRLRGADTVGARAKAARELGARGDQEALDALLATLEDRTLHPVTWLGVRDAFVAFGARAVPPLIERTRAARDWTTCLAIDALARLDDDRVDDVLSDALAGTRELLAVAAASGLLVRGHPRGKLHLAGVLGRDDPVGVLAAAGLAAAGTRTGLAHLLSHYFDPDLRPLLVWSLVTLPATARAMVADLLDDASTTVRLAAIDLVGVYELTPLAARLEVLTDSPDPATALGGAVALVRLRGDAALDDASRVLRRLAEGERRLDLGAATQRLWQPLPDGIESLVERASS